MSVSVAAPTIGARFATRRNMIIAGIVAAALAVAVGLGIVSRPDIANQVGDSVAQGVKNGVQGIKTVAAMMAERSPGERAKGALASLKHKGAPALHERALPKVRRPSPPVNPLIALLTPPPAPVTPSGPVPLYDLFAGPPTAVPPLTGLTGPGGGGGGGGTPGGPPSFTDIPPPGGGGGGIFVPPPTTEQLPPPPPPPPPPTSAVPEPGTWALMLLGFGFTGLALRRDRRRHALATPD